jgi:hypothetical protein
MPLSQLTISLQGCPGLCGADRCRLFGVRFLHIGQGLHIHLALSYRLWCLAGGLQGPCAKKARKLPALNQRPCMHVANLVTRPRFPRTRFYSSQCARTRAFYMIWTSGSKLLNDIGSLMDGRSSIAHQKRLHFIAIC